MERSSERMLLRTMTQFTSPVLHSLLDTDAYKLHMQQAVFHRYGDVHVAAEFRCRGDDLLGIYADAIREQVESMRDLRLRDDEYRWLSTLPFFRRDYLNWLRDFRYDPSEVTVSNDNGKLNIRLTGPWREAIMWEVPLLAVISELVHRYRSPEMGVDQALNTLEHKLGDFATMTADLDMSAFRLMDFGTRRRFSREVQEGIVRRLQQEPWFVGTSNYDLARRLNLTPMGTQAHEWFQAHQQISPSLASSQRAALAAPAGRVSRPAGHRADRLHHYGCVPARFRSGIRHPLSGVAPRFRRPGGMGRKSYRPLSEAGYRSAEQSAGLLRQSRLAKAVDLYRHFASRVKLSFGIGTRLTCDLPQVKPLNIVIKLVECNGKPVAKLSDSPGKTICHDKAFVRALREAFDLPPIKKAS